MTETRYRPPVTLVGEDGNAFAILGKCRRVLEKAERDGDLPEGTADEFQAEATSGDYNKLLATAMDYCDVS